MTSATERLRELLAERGVEWHGRDLTFWGDADATESIWKDDTLDVTLYSITPEQAIAATLGPGTCEVEGSTKLGWEPYYEHDLSCGHTVTSEWSEPPRFCPECGRRVVG